LPVAGTTTIAAPAQIKPALAGANLTTSGTTYLTLTYRQYALGTGISMNVQTSPDLQTWTTITNPTIIQTGTDPNSDDPIMQAQVPINGSRQFIRLNVIGQ